MLTLPEPGPPATMGGISETKRAMMQAVARLPHPAVRAAVEGLRPELERISRDLFDNPELKFNEIHAAHLLTGFLRERGFRVDAPVGKLDTAFTASSGEPSPRRRRLAFLAEYDALPRIGHACGHNLIAAGVLVAAAALQEVRPDLEGELVVIGTPAEEGGGGKILLQEQGVFDGIDAALMFHPADRTLPWRHARSCAHLRVEFHGRAAHASKNPEDGLNALAAMVQLFVAVDGLRQHLPPSARIHGVIRAGGDAPNVVPEYTCGDFLVREARQEETLALVQRFRDCATAAALATGTRVECSETAPLYTERKNNHTLATRVSEYLAAQGVEIDEPSVDNPSGSSDIGNISVTMPTIHPYLAVAPLGVQNHTSEFAEYVTSDRAHDATSQMAIALCQTALDLFDDPDFFAGVQREFDHGEPDFAR